ncbi:MAG: mandelate racemase/muconate lactonizing enzyme family protein [Proteobacteria bacterium]|nr:mandelate racemase/muconate lactonizing enzyme family protein [Pseudomonadota bacterium]
MKIERIRAYRVVLHTIEGRYAWGKGRFVDELDSTIICVDTDAGISGFGEVCCPMAPGYTPFFAAGTRAGTAEVAPALLGEDPTQIANINAIMDATLTGHDYAKSGIDIACWDILGKAAQLPVSTLLGGRFTPDFPLYHPVGQDTPEKMATRVAEYRGQGYKSFQLKVGGDVDTDIARIRAVAKDLRDGEKLIADANRGWLVHEALQVLEATRDIRFYVEQPCSTYEECKTVRSQCSKPFILDESIETVHDIVRAYSDGVADIINLKVAKLGGVTKTNEARNLCARLGMPIFIDNAKGGDIITAAMAHLAHSTPPSMLFATTDFSSYIKEKIATGTPMKVRGRLAASTEAGLGITPIDAMLNDLVLDVGK